MRWLFPLFCFFSLFLHAGHERNQAAEHKIERERLQSSSTAEPVSWWDGPHLTGTWGSAKQYLADRGITLTSVFVTDIAGNPSGGRAQGFAYAGSYGASMNVDFSVINLSGLDLFSSVVWRTGTSLSMRKIDNQFPVQQVFGSQTVKLNELYLVQTLFDERFAIKAGRLDGGNDFLTSPFYWKFVNNGFDGNPISIFFNVPFTAYPNSTWGAYLFAKPFKRLSIKVAAYNANTKIAKNKYHGANFTFKSTRGTLWMTEWCALVNQEPEDLGLPGNYKVGAFYLTGSSPTFGGHPHNGNPGLYFLFDQMVYRKAGGQKDQGLTPFISLIFQPKDRNTFPFFIDGGFVFQGPILSRPKDSLSVGFMYGQYSSDLARENQKKGKPTQSFESILEVNYWVQINPWFYIAPDLQYIIRPKGLNIPNAFVIAAQIGVDLW